MKPFSELSEHDKKLLRKINTLDEEWGWSRWPDIVALAEQLEDEEHRTFWLRQGSHYNHMEEARIGDL